MTVLRQGGCGTRGRSYHPSLAMPHRERPSAGKLQSQGEGTEAVSPRPVVGTPAGGPWASHVGMDVGIGTHLFHISKAMETTAAMWAGARLCFLRAGTVHIAESPHSFPSSRQTLNNRLLTRWAWKELRKPENVSFYLKSWVIDTTSTCSPWASGPLDSLASQHPVPRKSPASEPMLKLAAWVSSSLSMVSFRIQRTSCMYLYQHIHFKWALTSSWKESKNCWNWKHFIFMYLQSLRKCKVFSKYDLVS